MKIDIPVPVEQLVRDPWADFGNIVKAVNTLTQDERVELLEAVMLQFEQVDLPLEHIFAPGVYMRKGVIPKGLFVIGHKHNAEHLTAVFAGKISVIIDGIKSEFVGPCVFSSKAGTRKIIYTHEDATVANIHATTETDLDKLENLLITKSKTSEMFKQGRKSELMVLAEKLVKGNHLAAVQGELLCGQ